MNNFNVTAGDDFDNDGTIDADNVTIEVPNFADDITNTGTVSSDSLNFILTADFTHASDSFNAFNNFSNLTVSTDGTFTNNNTIDLDGNLTITANTFINTGGVVADALAISVAGDFEHSGTITTNSSNLQVGGDFSNNDSANDFTWGANDSLTVLGTASITADNFTNYGDITADTLALSVEGDFDYANDFQNNGNIDATTLNFQVGGNFSYDDASNDFVWNAQNSLTVLGTASITADNFTNYGDITADTLALSVEGDFDYANDFQNNGNIDATTLNFQVGGNFSYDDASNDFVWNAQNSLTVLGSASVTADSFTNLGYIDIANSFNVTAVDRFYNFCNNQNCKAILRIPNKVIACIVVAEITSHLKIKSSSVNVSIVLKIIRIIKISFHRKSKCISSNISIVSKIVCSNRSSS